LEPAILDRRLHSSAVEQLFRKQQVLGSNPSVGSTPSNGRYRSDSLSAADAIDGPDHGRGDETPIERAKTLLRTANLSVTEICFLVGFASLGSFSARFRELIGQSPSEYRDDAVARTGVPPIPGCMVLMWTRPHPDGEQSGRSTAHAGQATVPKEPQPKEHR
jgi:AraC-like DNA-binding protein